MFHNSRNFSLKSQLFARVFSHGENHEGDLPTTSRGLASVGDLVSQMYKLKTELPSTKPTLKFA